MTNLATQYNSKTVAVVNRCYSIIGKGNNRLLVIPTNRLLSYRFMANGKRIRFVSVGNQSIAKVGRKVRVYRKPNANTFHKELARQNSLAWWRGQGSTPVDTERLLTNMLEYIEAI